MKRYKTIIILMTIPAQGMAFGIMATASTATIYACLL